MATTCATTVAVSTPFPVSAIALSKGELKDEDEKADFSFSSSYLSLSKCWPGQYIVCVATPPRVDYCFAVNFGFFLPSQLSLMENLGAMAIAPLLMLWEMFIVVY